MLMKSRERSQNEFIGIARATRMGFDANGDWIYFILAILKGFVRRTSANQFRIR